MTSDSVRIDAGRFEQSPYFECYANPDTLLGVAANRYYPDDNGEDTEETYWALRQQAVLFDVPEKPWQIEGPDVVPFLERVFARPIDTLPEGRGRYAIACTSDGGIFMDGILFKLADNRYWYVQPDGALEEWLAAHKDGFDVRISDPHSRVLQIQGPNSMNIMSGATSGAIDKSLKYFDAGYFDIGGQRLYVSRTGWTGELGYEIYSDGESTDYERLWNDLFAAGSPHGMVFGSLKAMGIRRIEAGILDNLSDFDMSMTPFEAGLGAFIDLDKADFIGRSALLDANRESLLLGIKCPSDRPYRNAEIIDGETCVGQVTASAWSPCLESGIGYVRFNEAGDWVCKSLVMKTKRGELAGCEIVTLPFYDADKRIPRGMTPAD
ncbi:MAG: aminomethyltransferase family protein [Gammaproteobacteria bacterium]|nr:aminomethyltransferase family protein [Gammaproteobacteria bacterium]